MMINFLQLKIAVLVLGLQAVQTELGVLDSCFE